MCLVAPLLKHPDARAPRRAYNARMDENKRHRRWLSFGIRDLLWAMVVVGLALALLQQRAMWWETAVELKDETAKRTLVEMRYEHTKAQLDELVRLTPMETEGETDPAGN